MPQKKLPEVSALRSQLEALSDTTLNPPPLIANHPAEVLVAEVPVMFKNFVARPPENVEVELAWSTSMTPANVEVADDEVAYR